MSNNLSKWSTYSIVGDVKKKMKQILAAVYRCCQNVSHFFLNTSTHSASLCDFLWNILLLTSNFVLEWSKIRQQIESEPSAPHSLWTPPPDIAAAAGLRFLCQQHKPKSDSVLWASQQPVLDLQQRHALSASSHEMVLMWEADRHKGCCSFEFLSFLFPFFYPQISLANNNSNPENVLLVVLL